MFLSIKENATPICDENEMIVGYDVHAFVKCSCGYDGKAEVAWGSSLLQCPNCSRCDLTLSSAK